MKTSERTEAEIIERLAVEVMGWVSVKQKKAGKSRPWRMQSGYYDRWFLPDAGYHIYKRHWNPLTSWGDTMDVVYATNVWVDEYLSEDNPKRAICLAALDSLK